jgi:hypothetical protein
LDLSLEDLKQMGIEGASARNSIFQRIASFFQCAKTKKPLPARIERTITATIQAKDLRLRPHLSGMMVGQFSFENSTVIIAFSSSL